MHLFIAQISQSLLMLPFFRVMFFLSFAAYTKHVSNALVIIPTYNEKENINLIIDAVLSLPKDFHVLIVDDGSPDGTADIVKQLQSDYNSPTEKKLHLLQRSGKLGLGTAYITGFKYGIENGYDFLLEMDADFSHDPKDLVTLYLACAEGSADVSIGSRYATGVNVVNWPMGRVLMSYFASQYVQIITGIPQQDLCVTEKKF
jgi:dolichol-phosphate mannosyltransferase